MSPTQPISAAELLDVWEWELGRTLLERGLALLTAAWSETSLAELARLPIGRRDARLLQVRVSLFGPELPIQTTCPQCGVPLELPVHASDLLAAQASGASAEAREPYVLEAAGRQIHFRLPDSLDLLEAGTTPDPRRALLQRCVLDQSPAAEAGEASPVLPTEVETVLLDRMQALDPLAGASFALNCPACGHSWAAPFDIAGFVWGEVEAWAYRTLREVHWLASAYGWREADILALSSWRRQAYLQMSGYA